MNKRILAYLLVAAALILAIVRISDAYVEYKEHEIHWNAHPPPLRHYSPQDRTIYV